MSLHDAIGLFGSLLVVLVLAFQILRRLKLSQTVRAWLLPVLVMVLVYSAQGAALLYVRGLLGDLSMTSLALLCAALWYQLFDQKLLKSEQAAPVFFTVAVVGLFFYPLALRYTMLDPYIAGFGSLVLLAGVLLVGLLLWFRGYLFALGLLTAGLLAYVFDLLESDNLWDYLFDGWLFLISIFVLLKTIGRCIYYKIRGIPAA